MQEAIDDGSSHDSLDSAMDNTNERIQNLSNRDNQ